MVTEQRASAPNGASLARGLSGGNGRRTLTRDYRRLINECTEKLLSNPMHILAIRLRAQSYRMLGEDQAALADYNTLLEIDSTDVDALFYRGTILERQQHIDDAIECYTAVLQQEPQHHKALYNRAVCYSAKGSFTQAIEDFSAALELDQQASRGCGRRTRPQDQQQQHISDSVGAEADAAAAALLHGHPPRQSTFYDSHALSNNTSVSDLSATGWDRRHSSTSFWSTTPQSTASDPPASLPDEDLGTAHNGVFAETFSGGLACGSAGSFSQPCQDPNGGPYGTGGALPLSGAAGGNHLSLLAHLQAIDTPAGFGSTSNAGQPAGEAQLDASGTDPGPGSPGEPGNPQPHPHRKGANGKAMGAWAGHGKPSGLRDSLGSWLEQPQAQQQHPPQQQRQRAQAQAQVQQLHARRQQRQRAEDEDLLEQLRTLFVESVKQEQGYGAGGEDVGRRPEENEVGGDGQGQVTSEDLNTPPAGSGSVPHGGLRAPPGSRQGHGHGQPQGRTQMSRQLLRAASGQVGAHRAAAHGGVLREVQEHARPGSGQMARSRTPKRSPSDRVPLTTGASPLNDDPVSAGQQLPNGRAHSHGPLQQLHLQQQQQRLLAQQSSGRSGSGTPPLPGGSGRELANGRDAPSGRELRSPSPFERVFPTRQAPSQQLQEATRAVARSTSRGPPRGNPAGPQQVGGVFAPSGITPCQKQHNFASHPASDRDRGPRALLQRVGLDGSPTRGSAGERMDPDEEDGSGNATGGSRDGRPDQWKQKARHGAQASEQQQQYPQQLQQQQQQKHQRQQQQLPQQERLQPRTHEFKRRSGADGAPGGDGGLTALERSLSMDGPGQTSSGDAGGEGEGNPRNDGRVGRGMVGADGYAAGGRVGSSGDSGVDGASDGSGAASLDPWVIGGHGGMAAAVEMSRPSTSSSAASDAAADQNSRHKTIEQFNSRAFSLRQQGKLLEAVREYSRALELEPVHFKTLFNRGFTYDRLGELAAAVEDYTRALAVEPHSSYAHYNRGITRDRLQDFAGAVEDFTAAIRLEPTNADFYHNRGFALRKQGMFDAAIQDYSAAIHLNPSHCRAYYNRAFCHDRLNHVQPAIEDYSRALEMEPSNATALHNRGSLHERSGRHDLALQDYTCAIAADPTCAQSYTARGLLLQAAGRLGDAMADLDSAVALMQPPSAPLFRNRAQARRECGDHHGAVQDLTRAISLDPNDLLSYSRRAHCFRRMGEYESAIRDYSRAIGLSPNNPKLHTIRAYCYAMIGWYGEAVADYDVVLGIEPNNSHAQYNRSIALDKLGGAIDRAAAELSAAAAAAAAAVAAAGGGGVASADRLRQVPGTSATTTTTTAATTTASHHSRSRSHGTFQATTDAPGMMAAGPPPQQQLSHDFAGAADRQQPRQGLQQQQQRPRSNQGHGPAQPQGLPGLSGPKQAWMQADGRQPQHQHLQHQHYQGAVMAVTGGPPFGGSILQAAAGAAAVGNAALRGHSPLRGSTVAAPTGSARAGGTWGQQQQPEQQQQGTLVSHGANSGKGMFGASYASSGMPNTSGPSGSGFARQPGTQQHHQQHEQQHQQQQPAHFMQRGAAAAAASAW